MCRANPSPVVTAGAHSSMPDTLEEARGCIANCQLWHPPLWRSTMDADSYRRCLDMCSGLPPSQGVPEANWPQDLIAAVGQDVSQAIETVTPPLFLLAVIVVGMLLIVRRVT